MKRISVAIVDRNKTILLVRRKKKEGNLQWQFPAGEIENEETSDSTAVREVFEETDVVCLPLKKLGERVHPDSQVEIHYWLTKYIAGEAKVKDNLELDACIWSKPDEIRKLITSDLFEGVENYLISLEQS